MCVGRVLEVLSSQECGLILLHGGAGTPNLVRTPRFLTLSPAGSLKYRGQRITIIWAEKLGPREAGFLLPSRQPPAHPAHLEGSSNP